MAIRDRCWRRFQRSIRKRGKVPSKSNTWKHEKNWKLLYTRSVKLLRAKKLGIEYPRKTLRQILDDNE